MSVFMRALRWSALGVVAAVVLAQGPAARAQEAKDYLAAPGPLSIGGVEHRLAWSSNPSPTYYKQEYVPAGETPERFESMALVELVTSGATPDSAAAAQVKMVTQRKKSDPVANVAVLRNAQKGELLVDFVLSATTDKGEPVVEWSGYRYIAKGSGVLLLGVSRRAYGPARLDFMKNLKAARPAAIQALTALPVPDVRVAP